MRKIFLTLFILLITCAAAAAQDSPQTARKVVVGVANDTVTGNNLAGTISLVVGTTPGTGLLGTVTFALVDGQNSYTAAPKVFLFPTNANGAGAVASISGGGNTTTFTFSTAAALTAGQTYTWNYWVVQ